MEVCRRARGQVLDLLAVLHRPVDNLVVHIGDVARIGNGVIAVDMAEHPGQHVEDRQRAGIADMDIVINRRPTHIHAHIGRIDRNEGFLLRRE